MIADVQRIQIASREEWLKLRLQDVTASDVAALFGKSPYKTMLGLYAEKAGLIPDTEENAAMKRGRHIEHAIISALHEAPQFADLCIDKAGHYLRSPSLRLGATPDAYVHDGIAGGLEPIDAKSVASYVFDAQWADGVPLHIQLQVLTQAMLLNAPRGWVACGVMTAEFPVHIFEVPRHEKAERMIMDAVAAFWRAVEAGETPDPCAGDHDTLAALFPRADKLEPLDWSDESDLLALLERRAAIGEIVKPLEGEKAEIDAKLKASLGAHALALAPGWQVTWNETHRPEKLMPAATFRTLRVKALTPDQEEMAA